MARICIITGAHLCRNPRVVKEATALSAAGYEVVVAGPAWDEALSAEDAALTRRGGFEHRIVVDLRRRAGWVRHRHRIVRRLGVEAVARLGLQRPEALGYGVRETLGAARREQADLFIGHQEVGVCVAASLLREGKRAGADIEDWHSEDQLLEGSRRPYRLLRDSEHVVLSHGIHVTTTSHALAHALARMYGAPMPGVVYNAFPWSDRETLDGASLDRSSTERPSLHWVSQTIGPGRGLEELCDALQAVGTPVDVHLRGRIDEGGRRWIRDLFPEEQGHRLLLHDLVPPAELLSRIAEHDIGLALEWRTPPSRDLTVTNKILHYLLGGLAVIATDTEGQKEIARAAPEAVRLCQSESAASLAGALCGFIDDRARLKRAKAAALRAAHDHFNWEHQVPTLLQSVKRSLSSSAGSVQSRD